MRRTLILFDRTLHVLLDGYINAQRPGWARLQHWQWRLCNASEGLTH